MSRYYTVEEANEALPRLKQLMGQLQRTYNHIIALRPQIQSVIEKSPANSGSAAASEMTVAFMRFDEIIKKVARMGVEVKDVKTGLCDFLSLHPFHHGRDIYLCWQYGEEQVEWWHDIHAGFAGRRHVSELY